MGCLSRIGCLVVLAAGGAAGYYLYGDQFPSKVATAATGAAKTVAKTVQETRAASDSAALRDTDTSGLPRGAADGGARDDTPWVPLSAATRGNTDLSALRKKDGPAYLTLDAAAVASMLSASFPKQLPASMAGLQIALVDDELRMRAVIDVTELAGDGTLGGVLGTVLAGRDTLRLAGTVQPLTEGIAEYRITALHVKGMDVPQRLIPAVLRTLRRGTRVDGLSDTGLALRLPPGVADVRIARSRLTLYKAVP